MATSSAKVRTASRLRCKVRDNEPLTAEEKAWLAAYDAQASGPGRRRSPLPSLDEEKAPESSAKNAANAPEESHGAPHAPPPIDMREDASHAASEQSPTEDASGASGSAGGNQNASQPPRAGADGANAGQGQATSGTSGPSRTDEPPTPQELESYAKGCAAFCGWMNARHRAFEAEGLPAIPEEAIKTIVFASALNTAIMCHSFIKKASRYGAPIIFGGSFAMTMVGEAKLRRIRGTGSPQPKRAQTEAKEVPKAPVNPPSTSYNPDHDPDIIDLKVI